MLCIGWPELEGWVSPIFNILCTRHIAQCRGWSTMEGQVSPIFMVAGRLTSKIIFYKGLPWTQTHTVYIQYWEGPIDKYMMYCIQIHQFTIHTVFNTLPLKMNGIFTNPNYTQYSAGSYFTFETDQNLITYYDCGPRTNNIAFHFAVELMHCPFIYSRRLFTVTLVCYVLLKLGFVLRHVLMNKVSARTILYELVCSVHLKA